MSTGTTWTQELVWLIVNDCNFEKAKKTDLNIRSPYMEMNYLLSKSDTDRFQREAIARYYDNLIHNRFFYYLICHQSE